MTIKYAGLVGLAGLLTAASPAFAQKSADTIRVAINDMFPLVDPYNFPQDEQTSFNMTVYQGLLGRDERAGKYVGILATSWKIVDDKTYEFEIKPGVKFHNGDPLTADDFKATYDWATDEKTRIRFKDGFTWIDHTEVLSPTKLRVVSKEPQQSAMLRFAYSLKVLDAKALKSGNGTDYGRVTPYGTGSYKVVSIDNSKVVEERVDDYHHDSNDYFRAPVKRVVGIAMPDRQTQQAQLLTGGVDIIRNVPPDSAKELAKMSNLAVTPTGSQMMLYVTLDALGRSGNKAFMDERVRKAFIMSFDREALVKALVPAGEIAEIPAGICFKTHLACKVDNKPYAYNPAEAKKLLIEAGYPNGVDATMYVHEPVAYIATAIVGEVRKTGFRMNVESMPLGVYVKKRGDGNLTAFTGFYTTAVNPDAGNMINFFFN